MKMMCSKRLSFQMKRGFIYRGTPVAKILECGPVRINTNLLGAITFNKVGVWCAMSRRQIIRPIFFTQTITAERYCNELLRSFVNEFSEEEKLTVCFQQDGATAHTANSTSRFLNYIFQTHVISKGIWPPTSPDLSVLDVYLWGAVKQKVYQNKPQYLQELRDNIRHQIAAIKQEEIHRVFEKLRAGNFRSSSETFENRGLTLYRNLLLTSL